MQQLLLDLAQKSDDSLFIKITVVLTLLALMGLVFYVQSLGARASGGGCSWNYLQNPIGLISFAQLRSAECIQALKTKVQNNNYFICILVTKSNETMELLSSLNFRIDDLTLSATKLERGFIKS